MAENTASTKAMLDIIKQAAQEKQKVGPIATEGSPPVRSTPHGLNQVDEAISRFQKCYFPLFAAECRKHGVPFDQIHDLFQDMLLKLVVPRIDPKTRLSIPAQIMKYHQLEGSRFRSWVCIAFRWHVLSHIRTSHRETEGTGGTSHLLVLANLPTDGNESIQDPRNDWDLDAVKTAIDQLHVEHADDAEFDKCSLAFHLVYIEGKSLRDAMEKMGVTHETVRRWSHCFREMLLKKLRRRGSN